MSNRDGSKGSVGLSLLQRLTYATDDIWDEQPRTTRGISSTWYKIHSPHQEEKDSSVSTSTQARNEFVMHTTALQRNDAAVVPVAYVRTRHHHRQSQRAAKAPSRGATQSTGWSFSTHWRR